MSDWTEYEIEFREEDEGKIKEVVGNCDHREKDGKIVKYIFSQMAYGGFTENNKLHQAGMVFRGNHGKGSEFDCQVFASDGKTLAETPCDRNTMPVVIFRDGKVNEISLEDARKYEEVLKNANRILEA